MLNVTVLHNIMPSGIVLSVALPESHSTGMQYFISFFIISLIFFHPKQVLK